MRQIWITRVGGPEVLEVREAPDPTPGPGEVRIRACAAGINFADTLARVGLYPDAPKLPFVPGYEVAGVIDAVGAGVDGKRVGENVVSLTRFKGYADTVCALSVATAPIPAKHQLRAGRRDPGGLADRLADAGQPGQPAKRSARSRARGGRRRRHSRFADLQTHRRRGARNRVAWQARAPERIGDRPRHRLSQPGFRGRGDAPDEREGGRHRARCGGRKVVQEELPHPRPRGKVSDVRGQRRSTPVSTATSSRPCGRSLECRSSCRSP